MNSSFTTEADMVDTFTMNPYHDIESKYAEWNRWEDREVLGLFGVPDVLIAYGKIDPFGQKCIRTYAFELKLRNWRRALVQAYRYSAFSHYSWVVLDQAHINAALGNLESFIRTKIGLLSIDVSGTILCHNQAQFQEPYSSSLHNNLLEKLETRLFSYHFINHY